MMATLIEPRVTPVTPPPPNELKMNPPTMAPAMPISIVTMMPPGSRPGMISLARPPAINPRTIHAMMPMLTTSPEAVSLIAPNDQTRQYRQLTGSLFVVLGDVLLDQLGADPDVIERPVVVRDVGHADDLWPVPVLDGALHVEDPDLELAVGEHAANPRQAPSAGLQAHHIPDGEALRIRRAGRPIGVLGLAGPPGPELASNPCHRVVDVCRHALFQRDDRVVGDLDVLGANLLAALGDVAHAHAGLPVQ